MFVGVAELLSQVMPTWKRNMKRRKAREPYLSGVSEAVEQLSQAAGARKCWRCGCLRGSVRAIEAAYPGVALPEALAGSVELARAAQALLEGGNYAQDAAPELRSALRVVKEFSIEPAGYGCGSSCGENRSQRHA